MHRAKGEKLRLRVKGLGAGSSALYDLYLITLCSMFLALCPFYGCSPPADYYQQVLEMEEHGEQVRRDTGRRPGEIITPIRDTEPIETARSTEYQLMSDGHQQQAEEISAIEQEEVQEEPEKPPQRELVQESPSSPRLPPEPIAVASDVIKSTLEVADIGVSTRAVELVNGRLSGGKNSVRVNFLSESVDAIDDRFVAICAVIYYLNKEKNTVDLIVGIAEDRQAKLLAVLQSDMSDVAAWMTDKITRAEWLSMVTKKIL
jgi:hypothetical protein